MKKLLLVVTVTLPLLAFGQEEAYSISSYEEEGFLAPNTHYLGEAWLNFLIRDDASLGYNITKATFKANSTLDWHKHTSPQVLIIVSGTGYYQERGKKPILVKTGDVIKCSQDMEHWHASSKTEDVTYLAIYSGETQWTEVLSREAYDEVADALKAK